MKVLSYLEYTDYVVSDITGLVYIQENIPPDLRVITPICSLDELMSFYSQPFRPELITELFEGWWYDKAKEKYLSNYEDNGKTSYLYLNICFETNYASYNICGIVLPFPRTLDDFITDCERAGIQLEWRLQ